MAPPASEGAGTRGGAAPARGRLVPALRALRARRGARGLVALALLAAFVLLPLALSALYDVTITLDAVTERVVWELAPRADSSPTVLRVPPGEAATFALAAAPGGGVTDVLHTHRLESAGALAVQGPAQVELRRAGRGELRLRVAPGAAEAWGASTPAFAVEVYDGAERVATAHDTVSYTSRCHAAVDTGGARTEAAGASAEGAPTPCTAADRVFRALVRAERVVVGDHPVELLHPAAAGEGDDPGPAAGALRSGSLRAYDRALLHDTRYPLSKETLDAGDVVKLESGTGTASAGSASHSGVTAGAGSTRAASAYALPTGAAATAEPHLVWGSVAASFEEGDALGAALHVVAHTRRHRVRVERFGGGYLFGATRWDVLSSQPVLQAFWIGLVSFFLVMSGLQALRELVSPHARAARGGGGSATAEGSAATPAEGSASPIHEKSTVGLPTHEEEQGTEEARHVGMRSSA